MSSMERIPVAGPWITEKEIGYVSDAAANAWYAHANDYIVRFERAFAAHAGRRHAMALPSCTAGLHLSLLALGVGPGDEVIVPDLTWIASSAPISYVGAQPVFVDVDERTWCLDAKAVEACITPRTKAIIAVDIYGSMPDMDALLGVAARHRVPVIEDAAEAVGSEYHGQRAGSFGDVSVFSFHGSKTLTTGEGGMLLTDRTELFERAQFLRDHGRKPGDRMFFNHEVAHKYKMSALQAALGLAQLERVDELVEKKRQIFRWYQERLAGLPGVALNAEPAGTRNSYWMSSIILDERYDLPKTRLMEFLDQRLIDSRPFFHPLSSLPAYAQLEESARARTRNVVSYRVSPRAINLPSPLNLTEAQADRVCVALREILHA